MSPFLKTSRANGLVGLVDNKAEEEYAAKQKLDMNIKCRDVEQNITELSGGNQQKVILGKWMAAESRVIIFDEPTKGIDVGSKSEIYVLMRISPSRNTQMVSHTDKSSGISEETMMTPFPWSASRRMST